MDTQFSPHADLFPWHLEAWQKLTHRFPHLGHAFLLCGKQGAGKREFASFFTKWLLCQDKQEMSACGRCSSCMWIQAGTHPQLKVIQPDFDEKKQVFTALKIDQIREISDFVQQTVEGWRVVYIYPAEHLNTAAANALLKTLEEPGERVILLLISDAPLKLPATIRSRVQKIALDRIHPEQAKQFILNQFGDYSEDVIQRALVLAEYMPLKAKDILESNWFARRQEFYEAWVKLVKTKYQPIKFSTAWLKELEFKDILTIVRYILQDCIAYKLDQPIKQEDLDFSELAAHYDLEKLFFIYEHVNKINVLLNQNVQTQLIFDELAMQLMNVQQSA